MKKLLFVAVSLLAVSSSYAGFVGPRQSRGCPSGTVSRCPAGQMGLKAPGSGGCYVKCVAGPQRPVKHINHGINRLPKRPPSPCPAGYQAGQAQCPNGQVAVGMRIRGSHCSKCMNAPVKASPGIVKNEESFTGLGIANEGDGKCPAGWRIVNTRLGRKQGYRHRCIKPQN